MAFSYNSWQEIVGNWVYVPSRCVGVVHFLGGAFVATAPHLTYKFFLEELARHNYAILATPFLNTFDHEAIARQVYQDFEGALRWLQNAGAIKQRYLPIYGIGHSMGCKLHLLIGSLTTVERAGNIVISFNNYPARRSIPFLEQIAPVMSVEFTPSPIETNTLIAKQYQVRRNLLIQFRDDTIDQTTDLHAILQKRFPEMVTLQRLPGNHLTPLGPNADWKVGVEFSPMDAIGQWIKQGVVRDLNVMKGEILRWMNP